ncbi:MAG: hypothetical protein FWC40_05735, partial [Proteobacteria bacterium]|nr:hypothetical protein [Pseudomonadota bacterium]
MRSNRHKLSLGALVLGLGWFALATPGLAQEKAASLLEETRWEGVRVDGTWARNDLGLRSAGDGTESNAFWVSTLDGKGDGVIRAIFHMGSRPDSSLLFRAAFPENLAAVDGYSVTFSRQSVQLHRWDEGFAAPMTSRQSIKKLPNLIEVRVTLRGPEMQVAIIEPRKGTTLATLSAVDSAHRGHAVGYRAHRKQDDKTALQTLSFGPARESLPIPQYTSLQARVRQHPVHYVVGGMDAAKAHPSLAKCKTVTTSIIPKHRIYRCSPEAVLSMINAEGRLPSDLRLTEPRYAFEDSAYRQVLADMACKTPMHCKPDAPIDPNRSAKDVDMIDAYLEAYVPICKKRIRHVRLEILGYSTLGHPIRALVLTNASPKMLRPRVLLNGAHHGIELLSTDFVFDAIEHLCENPDKNPTYDALLGKIEVWAVPIVNPDGLDMYFHASTHMGRKNARNVFVDQARISADVEFPPKLGLAHRHGAYYRYQPNGIAVGAGVDINRNYPLMFGATGELASSSRPRHYWYRGPYAGSEPETQTMMNAFHEAQFATSISNHTVSTKILVPYSIDALKNPPRNEDYAWQLGERMAEAAGTQANGKPYEVVKNIYSVDGTDQDWFRMVSGTYAYLVEGALHNPTGAKQREAIVKNRPTWETLLRASASAHVIQVLDAHGTPAISEI